MRESLPLAALAAASAFRSVGRTAWRLGRDHSAAGMLYTSIPDTLLPFAMYKYVSPSMYPISIYSTQWLPHCHQVRNPTRCLTHNLFFPRLRSKRFFPNERKVQWNHGGRLPPPHLAIRRLIAIPLDRPRSTHRSSLHPYHSDSLASSDPTQLESFILGMSHTYE